MGCHNHSSSVFGADLCNDRIAHRGQTSWPPAQKCTGMHLSDVATGKAHFGNASQRVKSGHFAGNSSTWRRLLAHALTLFAFCLVKMSRPTKKCISSTFAGSSPELVHSMIWYAPCCPGASR